MQGINTYVVTAIISLLIILSYVFTLVSKKTRIPGVILLIGLGVIIREIMKYTENYIPISNSVIEFVGVIGLIMIVLEAGLSLRYSKSKLPLIRNALLSSFFALAVSVAGIAILIHWQLGQSRLSSIVYAIPLSVLSSSIILSSISTLNERKREFLAYESSFSDILGILIFDYIIAAAGISIWSLSLVGVSIVIAIAASVVFSVLLVWILSKSQPGIKFYLMFSILLLLYSFGRLLHLPSLLILLVFGLMLNNWSKLKIPTLQRLVPKESLAKTRVVLKSITVETTFLVRTLFFVLFGYSINLSTIASKEVALTGLTIVLLIYIVRYMYLRIFVTQHVLPEIFYAPRGLVTILLFYKIPDALKLASFNDGVILFVVVATSLVMMFGALFFTPPEANDQKLNPR